MSTTMGMASVFALSALLLSPLALAEESPAFVAQHAARGGSEQHTSAAQGQSDSGKDS